jgi:nucleotide-binding universal stress UspA family protein
MFRRILVPLDGSELAERALPIAARLALATGGSITLLRVVPSPLTFASQRKEPSVQVQGVVDTDLVGATAYLTHITASSVLAGVATATEVFKDTPAERIISVARSQQMDIIIMCSHGYTGMTRWALGSVAEKVASHAPVPVLVLRKDGPIPASLHTEALRPIRMLVALDGSERAERGIEPAASLIAALAAPFQGALHLMQVVQPATAAIGKRNIDENGESQANLDKVTRYLSSLVDHSGESRLISAVADLKLQVSWSVAVDPDIASALIRVAENGEDAQEAGMSGGYDIITMTTHGYGGEQRWGTGSITARVLRATKLPLLIVRPPDIMEKSNLTWNDTTISAI